MRCRSWGPTVQPAAPPRRCGPVIDATVSVPSVLRTNVKVRSDHPLQKPLLGELPLWPGRAVPRDYMLFKYR